MAKPKLKNELTAQWVKAHVALGERFERSDGAGLTLAFRDGYGSPVWRLRYRIAGWAATTTFHRRRP